jgi:predicted translin family RNA/ssDNA-binding protein
MYQKDYILRMIEMLGELIRAILGLIVKGTLHFSERMRPFFTLFHWRN